MEAALHVNRRVARERYELFAHKRGRRLVYRLVVEGLQTIGIRRPEEGEWMRPKGLFEAIDS